MSDPSTERRSLGFVPLLALGLNGIIGVGIFFVPSRVAELVPGSGGTLVYALTALALVPVALVYATLGARFDEDGGPYVWARAAFGAGLAFGVGWLTYVSALFSTSAVMAGFTEHAGPLLGFTGPTRLRLFAAAAVVGLASLNATGLRPSAIVWTSVTVLKLLPLLLLAALFLVVGSRLPSIPTAPDVHADVLRAALVIVFSLQGFEIVPVPAGHARSGARAIPPATILSLAVAALLYVLLHAACVRALPNLAATPAPLVAAGAVYGGPHVAWLVGLGTNVSALGIAFGMFAMTPRFLAALGRSDALGTFIGTEDQHRVPQRALWVTAIAVLVLVQAGKVAQLFVLSSVSVLAQYAVSSAALAVLAVRGMHGLRPIHLAPAPLALGAILMVGRAAKAAELAVAAAVLSLGALLLIVAQRARSRA